MPLKVKRLFSLFLLLGITVVAISAQTADPAELTRQRLARARALVASRNWNAALVDLEKVRKESTDEAAQNVARVMIVNIYLEQADYKRAQALIDETYRIYKNRKASQSSGYFAVVGQCIKSANQQLERYRSLGLKVNDQNMPTEAAADLEKWRGLLETIVAQAKELSEQKDKQEDALVLLEQVANTRSALARDDYEASRWRNEIIDTREKLANSQMQVAVVDDDVTLTNPNSIATNTTKPNQTQPQIIQTSSVEKTPEVVKQPETTNPVIKPETKTAEIKKTTEPNPTFTASTEKETKPTIIEDKTTKPVETKIVSEPKTVSENNTVSKVVEKNIEARRDNTVAENTVTTMTKTETEPEKKSESNQTNPNQMMAVGSLIDMATRKYAPTYPPVAKNARVTGVVRVDLIIDEEGSVADVRGATGPELLRRAATDAVKRWKFKPVLKDGQPVRATGFINFNFSL